jgi:hypothetical protein
VGRDIACTGILWLEGRLVSATVAYDEVFLGVTTGVHFPAGVMMELSSPPHQYKLWGSTQPPIRWVPGLLSRI